MHLFDTGWNVRTELNPTGPTLIFFLLSILAMLCALDLHSIQP